MRTFYTGIDIGTSAIKVVVAAPPERSDVPMQILGTGLSTSKGLRQGYVVDSAEVTRSLREALARASAAAKVTIKQARVGISGVGLEELHSTGEVSLTQSGSIVTDRDIERATKDSETRCSNKLANRIVIHAIPLEHRVDGTKILGKAVGMQGAKLSVDTLLVTVLTQHHDNLEEAVEAAGVEVESMMAGPLAASLVTLEKKEKIAGVMLANIGAETLSTVVYDNDLPISLKVYPKGSTDITNAIALSFRIPLTEAEQIKRGAVTGSDIPQKKLDTIISAQLRDMYKDIQSDLKAIGRAALLPGGVVLTGGGSSTPLSARVAEESLKLPSRVAQIGGTSRGASSADPMWSVAYGLCRLAYGEDMGHRHHALGDVFSHGWESVKNSIRSLLP